MMLTRVSRDLQLLFSWIEEKLNLYNHKFYFFLILGFGIILRGFSLTENGLWIDEIWSMDASKSQRSIAEIIDLCIADTHPPVFDILLHLVLNVSNDYEFTGRYVSLFFGIIGVILTHYYAFKITLSRKLSLFAMALVAFNYFHITYSFEGRFYSLVYLLSLISLAELYLFLKHKNLKHLIIFLITNILFVYTHYYGAILLTSLSLIVLVLWISREISNKMFIQYIVCCFLILISFLPWLPHMLGKEGIASWMQVPKPTEFFVYYALYTGKNPIESLILFTPLLLTFKLYKTDKKLAYLLVGSILLSFIIPFTVSHVFTPMLHVRYTIIYLPSIIILAAIFWYRLEILSINFKKWLAAFVFLSMMTSLLMFSRETKAGFKDGWKNASIILNRTDATNIFTEHNLYLNYYLDYHGEKYAGDFNDFLKTEARDFWLLSTPYDSKRMFEEVDLQIIQEHHLPNNFILYQVVPN